MFHPAGFVSPPSHNAGGPRVAKSTVETLPSVGCGHSQKHSEESTPWLGCSATNSFRSHGWFETGTLETKFHAKKKVGFLSFDSFSILFSHGSFQKPAISTGFVVVFQQEGSRERTGKLPLEPSPVSPSRCRSQLHPTAPIDSPPKRAALFAMRRAARWHQGRALRPERHC